jgi:hypothetical protein
VDLQDRIPAQSLIALHRKFYTNAWRFPIPEPGRIRSFANHIMMILEKWRRNGGSNTGPPHYESHAPHKHLLTAANQRMPASRAMSLKLRHFC